MPSVTIVRNSQETPWLGGGGGGGADPENTTLSTVTSTFAPYCYCVTNLSLYVYFTLPEQSLSDKGLQHCCTYRSHTWDNQSLPPKAWRSGGTRHDAIPLGPRGR